MRFTPTIETDRLILRLPKLEDWPNFETLMTSDRVNHMGGPYSVPVAWGWFCHGIALWQLFDVGNLSIISRQTGECLGQIEINQGPGFPEPELGWQLIASAEGRGLAIWATYMIRATALDDPNGVTTLRRATAVRINMHLYRQLNFGRFEPAPDTDDDYQE